MAQNSTTAISTVPKRRRIFIDTSAWYAVAATGDRYHAMSRRYFEELLQERADLATSDFVLDETLTRLRYDFGLDTALTFWQKIEQAQHQKSLTLLAVDSTVWHAALTLFREYPDQKLSFTDCTSFRLANDFAADAVFAFDHHFSLFGHIVQPVP